MSRSRRRCGRTEARFGSRGPRDGRRSARRWRRRRLDGAEHLPGEGSDRHDAGDRPHNLRRRLGRRGLSRVRPMDRLVWVGAFPHEDNVDVRPIVSAALEAGFEQIVLAERDESFRGLGRFSPILLKGNIFFFDDAEIGRLATIRSAKDETSLRSLRGATKHIVVRTEDWKVIPLENLIAHFQGSDTRLLVEVHDAAEAKLVFETMEVGVHGILLVPSSPNEIRAVRGLRAGGEVLAVDSEGRSRAVIVGRVKVERRPLLLLEAEAEGRRYTTIVQNAETIRFVTPEGGSLAVSQVKAGDEVLVRLEEGGRHFGMRIRETIAER